MKKITGMVLLSCLVILPSLQMAAGSRKPMINGSNGEAPAYHKEKALKRNTRFIPAHGSGFGNGYQG